MDKEYIVTLYRKEDLERFYREMQISNFPLVKKRPMSRNTHYMMTEEQAHRIRQDSRVWGVEAVDSFSIKRQVVNREPYNISGNFWKDDTQGAPTISPNDYQWGHIHCAGDPAQRGKGQFGPITQGGTYEQVIDTVEVFNSGKHVDVVIVDDPVSYDSEEWYSPTTGQSRFVQYQWFNELNTLVNTIDDDGQTEPTGTITYGTNASTPQYHGNHVAGTACGQHYGWARESNIYNLAVTDPWPSGQQIGALLIFDYLRAFHRTKAINTDTGKKNPTITNHSYGGVYNTEGEQPVTLSDVSQIVYRGTSYSALNPGPSGWTEAGISRDFGFRFGYTSYPAYSSAVAADVQDAIEEGIVVIGAAGNDNMLMTKDGDPDYYNTVTISGIGTIPYNRGAWPNTADSGSINVGALNKRDDFRRSTYTMFGPSVDIFAPGDNILSAYGNTGGLNDTKYTQGSGNYYYPIQGTSMASPQVCGVVACLATGKDRFTQGDAINYLNMHSIYNDMTFDVVDGSLADNSCQQGSPNKYLSAVNPRQGAGFILEQKGGRTPQYFSSPSGVTFPRVSTLHAPAPVALSKTFPFTVTNSGASHYVFTGDDRSTTHTSANDPTLNVNSGDILEFNVSVSGHPFLVKTAATTGTGDQVPSYLGSGNGVLRNGATSGAVTFYTEGLTGTYYYICQFHGGMVGSIIIS